jgi:hypothetical protein
MDFSGLVSGVREFWNFIWPPIICLVMLLAIARFVAGGTCLRIWTWLKTHKPEAAVQLSIAKTLKHFGADKLLPFAIAFCLLFVLDMVRAVVVVAGAAVSPQVVYRYDVWLGQRIHDEQFGCLWLYYGEPRLDALQNHIGRTLSQEETLNRTSRLLTNVRDWEEQGGEAAVAFSACKFLIVWATFWAILEGVREKTLLKPGLRLLICLVVLVGAGTIFFFRQIWAVDQAESARVSAAEVLMVQRVNESHDVAYGCRGELTPEQASALDMLVSRDEPRHWWEFRAFDWYYARWIWSQVAGRTP